MAIRFLRPGEAPPPGEPRRYPNNVGYVRLRWRVGPGEYVEVLEHRFVTNAPAGKHVHHIDGDPSNNDPDNLRVVTTREHGREHRTIDRKRAVELYAQGLSTPEVGRLMGHNPAAIYRALVAEGVTPRSSSESQRMATPDETIAELHRAGVRSRRIARHLGVSASLVDSRVRELGLAPHRDGRPTNAEIESARSALARLA